jgi:hypothetical protein
VIFWNTSSSNHYLEGLEFDISVEMSRPDPPINSREKMVLKTRHLGKNFRNFNRVPLGSSIYVIKNGSQQKAEESSRTGLSVLLSEIHNVFKHLYKKVKLYLSNT